MMEWEVRDVFKLISLYKKCYYLWDCTCQTYNNCNMKNRAWFQIAKEMDKPVDEVKRKIKHLRCAYISERKKLTESLKAASSPEEVYCPCLFYFEKMRFLDDIGGNQRKSTEDNTNCNGTPRQDESVTASETEFKDSRSSDCISNTIMDFMTESEDCSCGCGQNKENNQEERSSEQSLPTQESTTNQSKTEKEDTFDGATANKVEDNANENSTIYNCFAKSIELQLSHLPIVLSAKAMAEMQQILANYMGQNFYDQNTQNSNTNNNESELSRDLSPKRRRK